jgi:Bifunctional DNA primase/polymerase, N-terminal
MARLRYAEKGVPTSPADTKKKKPVLKGWQTLATTDPRRIHAEFNDHMLPDYDGVLTPTGAKYRRIVLDVDSLSDFKRLEGTLGAKLRGISTEVQTPSGSLHVHLLWPEGVEIRNSVGKHISDGFEGLDIRGEGGLVLLPPSAGYSFANSLPMAPAPPELVSWAKGRRKKMPRVSAQESHEEAPASGAGPILKGARHSTLPQRLGRYHNGVRTLEELTEIALEINARECVPPIGSPGDDPIEDVHRIARWLYTKPPCGPRAEPDPEFEELLEEANRGWYERFLLGGDNKSTIRETVRACLGSIAKRREVRTVVVGTAKVRVLVFAESTRELERLTRSSARAISEHLCQLQQEGILVVLHRPPAGRTTYGLLPAARWRISPQQLFSVDEKRRGLMWNDTLPRCYELRIPPFGWRSRLTNAMRRVLCIIEAFGPQSAEWLNRVLGTARQRDLERRELRGLEVMGLLEKRGGEEWGLLDNYLARIEALEDEEYSTTFRRRRRSRDGKRVVTDVVEVTVTASENGRDALREARHAIERAAYAVHLEEDLGEDDRCRELLNAWDEEREEADCYVGELERNEEPQRLGDGASGDTSSASGRRGSTEDRTERVERLVRQGMARRFSEAEVYGEAGVLGVGG